MNGEQTELGFPLTELEQMEKKGRWPDLSRLQQRKPDALRFAIYLLAHRVPFRETAKVTGICPRTLQEIADHPTYGKSLLAQKERVATNRRWAIELGVANLREAMANGLKDAFAVKLLWDMEQVEAGGVTQRVELRMSDEDAESLRFFQEARRQPGMVFDVEGFPPTGAGVQPDPTQPALMLESSGVEPPVTQIKTVDNERVIVDVGGNVAETGSNRGGGEGPRAPTPDGGPIQPEQKFP